MHICGKVSLIKWIRRLLKNEITPIHLRMIYLVHGLTPTKAPEKIYRFVQEFDQPSI